MLMRNVCMSEPTILESQLWEILVPYSMGEHDNLCLNIPRSNKTVPVPYHQDWDAEVRRITGGLTILKCAKGEWVDEEGAVYRELMIPVRIACTEQQIIQIAQFTQHHYRQKAVFCSLVSERTLIIS
jgi:hypothetical protein